MFPMWWDIKPYFDFFVNGFTKSLIENLKKKQKICN